MLQSAWYVTACDQTTASLANCCNQVMNYQYNDKNHQHYYFHISELFYGSRSTKISGGLRL